MSVWNLLTFNALLHCNILIHQCHYLVYLPFIIRLWLVIAIVLLNIHNILSV